MDQKAKGVKQLGPDVLEVKEKIWVFTLLGLAALLPGLFMLFGKNGDLKAPDWVFTLISIPFLLAGIGILLAKSVYTFDRRRDKIVKWWGIFKPFSQQEFGGLSTYRLIVMIQVRKGKGRNERIEYPVWLETEGPNVQRLSLMSGGNYKYTRGQIEAIAHFLGIQFADRVR